MSDHAQQVESPRIFRVRIACEAVEPLRLAQATSAMLGHRGSKRLFRTAPGTHDDISDELESECGSLTRRTDSDQDPDQPRRGCHRPRPVDRKAALASRDTACCTQYSRRDASRAFGRHMY